MLLLFIMIEYNTYVSLKNGRQILFFSNPQHNYRNTTNRLRSLSAETVVNRSIVIVTGERQ